MGNVSHFVNLCITLLILVSLALAEGQKCREPEHFGCRQDIELNDKELVRRVNFAIAEHNKKAGKNLILVKVIIGMKQLETNNDYKFLISTKDEGHMHTRDDYVSKYFEMTSRQEITYLKGKEVVRCAMFAVAEHNKNVGKKLILMKVVLGMMDPVKESDYKLLVSTKDGDHANANVEYYIAIVNAKPEGHKCREPELFGGRQNIPELNDKELVRHVNFAIAEYNKKAGKDLILVKVIIGMKQPETNNDYKFLISTKDGTNVNANREFYIANVYAKCPPKKGGLGFEYAADELEDMGRLYERWRAHYKLDEQVNNRFFAVDEQMNNRFTVFRENVLRIHRFNELDEPYKLGLNQFSDLTSGEFAALHTCLRSPDPTSHLEYDFTTHANISLADLPPRSTGELEGPSPLSRLISTVVWACWAFSTVGSMEGLHFIRTGKLLSLSAQELVDCDKRNLGCEGGFPRIAFDFIRDRGITSDQIYPYQDRQGTCNVAKVMSPVVRIDGFRRVPVNNEMALMRAVAQQPVSVLISTGGNFGAYKTGVFTGHCGIDHAVTVVGYGKSKDGRKYWIVKNSWGSSWGDKGYILLGRDMKKKGGQCNIARFLPLSLEFDAIADTIKSFFPVGLQRRRAPRPWSCNIQATTEHNRGTMNRGPKWSDGEDGDTSSSGDSSAHDSDAKDGNGSSKTQSSKFKASQDSLKKKGIDFEALSRHGYKGGLLVLKVSAPKEPEKEQNWSWSTGKDKQQQKGREKEEEEEAYEERMKTRAALASGERLLNVQTRIEGRRPIGRMVGAYDEITNLNDKTVMKCAKFAVSEHNKKTGTNLILVKIAMGLKHRVAGWNYRLVISTKNDTRATANHDYYLSIVYESLPYQKRTLELRSFEKI
ncbi:cysteine proteinases superfamily protein [Striga asiatica]|uniref:Cysteine proteinases superfamily protein n=1 Tax=Striga asiatica TaxID=4170 RepID=A0A5A7RHW7_STRAF|nr:cysteine proteinases superfamily protein [Striga asiatica]